MLGVKGKYSTKVVLLNYDLVMVLHLVVFYSHLVVAAGGQEQLEQQDHLVFKVLLDQLEHKAFED